MKKVLSLLLLAVLLMTCLSSCNQYKGKIKSDINENYAIITLDDFSGKHTFKVKRAVQGEGMVYYQVSLTSGTLTASFYENSIIGNQPLFTMDAGDAVNGSTGYLEGNGEIEFTIEADTSVSGEIIVAFSEDVLKAIHRGDLLLHKHTFYYETIESSHKMIYTCDCDWLDERSFERHYDEDCNGKCDECDYYIGIPHEDHSYGYDVNETSHRIVYDCDCESPSDYEAHYNDDGDTLCDVCGYELFKLLNVDRAIELSAKGNELTWSDFAEYKSVETGSGLYILVYEIDETFQVIIGGTSIEESPMYIRLALTDNIDEYVDMRSGTAAVKAFHEAHSN